jgi:hypothetical protein
MDPTSVSPVLKSELTIFLADDYAAILNREDFTATLYSEADSTLEKELYVMSVDESSKSIQVKFPGAPSGQYSIQISAN